jgi:hypothetical protein
MCSMANSLVFKVLFFKDSNTTIVSCINPEVQQDFLYFGRLHQSSSDILSMALTKEVD